MNIDVGTYLRPCFGERAIGDAVVTSVNDDYSYLIVIDGIGHGVPAEIISQKIKRYVGTIFLPDPAKMIEKIHAYMAGSEGAVIGVSVIDHLKSTLTYAALGNISCRIIGEKNKMMVPADGLVGVRFRSVVNEKALLHHRDLIVMHSDGVSSTSEILDFPKLYAYSPALLAKKLVQTFGNEYDDSSCITARCKLT